MAPVAIRKPVVKAPAHEVVSFGDLSSYSSGGMFLLPEGDYSVSFDVRIHAYTKKDNSKGTDMLGVMGTFVPLAGGAAHEHFFSLGKKAITAFMPDPETGKKLVKIPGRPAVNLGGLTAWGIFLKSLYDCGLPPGLFTDDISVLDGIWIHTQNEPAPPELKELFSKNQTGEAAMNGEQAKNREPDMVCKATEIKDDGKPWEGTGGVIEATEEEAEAPKPVAKVAAKPAAKAPVATKKAAPKVVEPVEEEAAGDEAVREAALAAVTELLGANEAGMPKIMLRTKTFAAVKAATDDDTAQAVIEGFFANDDDLNGLVGELGYEVKGIKVQPAA